MDETSFEGTLVLEKLFEMGLLDEFFQAIDLDDFSKVKLILESAGFDDQTISTVHEKMQHQDDH